ncbi:MAG: OmpA family protein [Acidobacteriota bacterium]|nr:OmpA family protein [Acidobacteriota bacterium]MDE3163904.1 OmpA family protein [Acidobacteriota bacterium]
MDSRTLKSAFRLAALACVALLSVAASAQSSSQASGQSDTLSKWDIFAGYSYLAPKATVNTLTSNGTTLPFVYRSVDWGSILSVARYFNKYVGVEAIGDEHIVNEGPGSGSTYSNSNFSGGSGGVIFRFPSGDFIPFLHGLAGAEYADGPSLQKDKWGPALTAGGGADYNTPLFNHHLAIRVFQADYQYIHENWGPGVNGGRANINAARLSTGFVYHIGSIAPPTPITMACSASPSTVYPGDPVALTGNAGGLDPKLNTVYAWSGNGVTGSGSTAKVDTTSLAPGTYTVKCGAKQGKTGKEGLKPWQNAEGSTTFTVKQFDPPTVSCVTNPSSVKPGEAATITATGVSPQNRPLTYTYSAAAGTINGTGNSATFNSTGAPTGPVAITCNVADDKGQTASANTEATVLAPPPPPGPSPEQVRLESRLALHSIFFPTDKPSKVNPEGGLLDSQKATLASLASDFKSYLQFKPDAHLILTGHTDPRGSAAYNMALSDRRVTAAKQFLVDQGIPASNIETTGVGEERQLSADDVKALVDQNPDLSDALKTRYMHNLSKIVLAQNRRVDVTLSTTGQQSVRLYPFNAADAMTLMDEKAPVRKATKKAK